MEGDDLLPVDLWSYSCSDDFLPGEKAAATADNSSLRGRYSADDLFELVWQGGGGGGGGATGQPAVSCLRSSPLPALAPPPPESERILLDQPPFDEVMAAWLYPIVSGQGQDADGLTMKEASELIGSSGTMMSERKGKLLATDGMSGTKTISCNMGSEHMNPVAIASSNYHEDTNTKSDPSEKKALGGSSSRKGSSNNSGTHSIAEKRRRCKITERLRTLQQLVPGCDKSNQASTLDRTIQYMKSLQSHVQAMSMRPAIPSSVAAPAGYPFVHTPAASVVMPMPMPPATVGPGTTVAAGGHVIPPSGMVPMVPFGPMLPYQHYHSLMTPAAAAMAGPLYRPAPDVSSTSAAGECRDFPQSSVSMEQQQHKKEKGSK